MDATEHFHRGLNYYDECRFDDAGREFTLAIESSPDFADAYTGRGHVHSVNRDYVRAISDFNEAIRLNPVDADAWQGRADARLICGNYGEAIEDFNRAIALNSRDAYSFHRRGDAHATIRNVDNAISDYRQAIVLEPNNPISHYFLASSLTQNQCFAEAINHYEEALRIDLDLDAFVYACYAWLLATCHDDELRNPVKAIQLATTACEYTDWCEDQELGVLAAAYAANGDFENAAKWQSKAVQFAEEDRKELQCNRLDVYRSGRVCDYVAEP